ncbi:MAG TPA: PQQ-binding-like beta-propeller repeat protein [Acidobacteriota bacterium]|nr:PQQ-binding-like beta-propeller repeat protein [Acidobacteriota bacterium]
MPYSWRVLALLAPLLCAQAAPQAPDLDQQLVAAAAADDLAEVEALLGRGADVNADNGFGVTALYSAADWGRYELVRLLLESGANPDSNPTSRGRSPWGKTPLQLAAGSNTDVAAPEARAAIVRLLIEHGGGTEGAALRELVWAGYLDAVRTIVGRGGTNPSYLNAALGAAQGSEHTELAAFLVAAGAEEPTAADRFNTAERLELLEGVYQAPNSATATLRRGLEDGELILERTDRGDVIFVPATLTILRSLDRTAVAELRGRTLPPSELVVTVGDQSDLFVWTAPVTERPRAAPVAGHATNSPRIPPTTSGAREWASFRGPGGSGVADGADLPTEWDAEQGVNVAWKTPIPGLGHSSPIVWGNRVFVTTAVPSAGEAASFRDFSEVVRSGVLAYVKEDVAYSWRIVALDKGSGEILWERAAYEGIPRTARHVMASHANQTPVTDGTHVVAWFGSEGVYCYDFDGNLLWSKDLGPVPSGRYFDPGYEWNTASSPIIHENLVILQVDGIHEAYLLALDVATGEEVWRTERDEHPSWPTPFIYEDATRIELVTAAIKYARGYDPDTGEELWRLGLHGDFPTPTPIAGGGLIFITSGYGTLEPIYAIRPGASGDITLADSETYNDSVAWSKRRGGAVIPTPIVYGEMLYVLRSGGILAAYQAETGERIYQSRITRGRNYSASPVAADGKIYFANEDGEVVVIKAGPEFERLAVNQMGEPLMATPAIAPRMMIFRMQEHVVAIATP